MSVLNMTGYIYIYIYIYIVLKLIIFAKTGLDVDSQKKESVKVLKNKSSDFLELLQLRIICRVLVLLSLRII